MVAVLAVVAGCTAITSTGEHEFASSDGDRNIPSQNGCLVNASGSCTLAPHDGAVLDGELPMDGGADASGTGGAGGRGGESAAGQGGAGAEDGGEDAGHDAGGQAGESGEGGASGASGNGSGGVGGEPNDDCPDDDDKTAPGQCGCGTPDIDGDHDEVASCDDACDGDPNKTEPGLCGCGVSDSDSDSDETPNCLDGCDDDPDKTSGGVCGCGIADSDRDSDEALDCQESCDDDPNKTSGGVCGCGVADVDTDSDEALDCQESCDNDPNKTSAGECGCGVADTDSDADETADCDDQCEDDPNKIAQGQCGCGMPDTDSDGDETADCIDGCPDNPDQTGPGQCGCGFPEPPNYCSQLPYLPLAPVIDGVVDCGLPLSPISPVGWNGAVDMPDGQAARFAVAWRPHGIYFYVEIDDPDLDPAVPGADNFCGDGVQLYVDADGSWTTFHQRPGSVQLEVRAPDPGDSVERSAGMYTHPSDAAWDRHGNWHETTLYGAYPRAGGYAVEALVTAGALGMATFMPVGHVGISIGVNVSDADDTGRLHTCPLGFESKKLGQFYLRLGTATPPSCPGSEPWCTSTAFCRASLAAAE